MARPVFSNLPTKAVYNVQPRYYFRDFYTEKRKQPFITNYPNTVRVAPPPRQNMWRSYQELMEIAVANEKARALSEHNHRMALARTAEQRRLSAQIYFERTKSETLARRARFELGIERPRTERKLSQNQANRYVMARMRRERLR